MKYPELPIQLNTQDHLLSMVILDHLESVLLVVWTQQFGVTSVDVSNAAAATSYGISVSTAGNNSMTITDGTTTQTVSITTAVYRT